MGKEELTIEKEKLRDISWKFKKLKEVCSFQNGFAFKSKLYKKTGLPIIRITNIQDDKIDTNSIVYFNLEDYKRDLSNYKIYPGDLLIAMSGATTGKIGINNTNEIFYLNQRVGKFKPKEDLNKTFLYYYLATKVEESLRISEGAAQPNLSSTQIKNFKIPVPSLPEQHRIVSKLDALFAEIDASLALIDQNLAQAEALKLSVLDEELNTNSEEIKISKLLVNTKNINPKEVYKEKDFTYIDISSINKDLYRIETPKVMKGIEAPSRARREVRLGDIVFATTRPNLKNVAIVDKEYNNSIASTGFCVLRPKQDKLINSFLFYFLISNKLQDLIQPFIRGAQYPAISDKNLKGIKLATPSIEVQQKIVQKLDALFAEIDALVLDYTKKRDNLEALKSSLLDQAFKGEL